MTTTEKKEKRPIHEKSGYLVENIYYKTDLQRKCCFK